MLNLIGVEFKLPSIKVSINNIPFGQSLFAINISIDYSKLLILPTTIEFSSKI